MSKISKNARDCPAAERAITSRECGEGRHAQFTCPETCPHNPLSAANYDDFGEIELRVIRKTVETLQRENRGDFEMLKQHQEAMQSGIGEATAFCLWHSFWARDTDGRTLADRWEARRFEGLSNDERAVFAGHRRARPALWEIRRIIDDTLVAGVDLFTGEEVTLADRSLAGSAVRFETLFGWFIPLPHFTRILGAAVILPEIGPLEPKEILLGTVRHLGGPEEPAPLLRWLAEHWRLVANALGEISKALRHQTLSRIDVKYHSTSYRLVGDAQLLREKLLRNPHLVPESPAPSDRDNGFAESFVWLENERPEDPGQPDLPALTRPDAGLPGPRVIGRVLLGAGVAQIEASSAARNAQLRPKFERMAANLVRFHSEKIEDLGAQVAGEPNFDPAMVPPQFLEHATHLEISTTSMPQDGLDPNETAEAFQRRHREGWLDHQIPALAGHTPREAAQIPALRGQLIRMVKGIVAKADRESEQTSEEATQLIATLGLTEIVEPTPPARPNVFVEPGENSGASHADEPPIFPLTPKVFEARLRNFVASYPIKDAAKLDEDFEVEAPDLLELFDNVAGPILQEFEQDCLFVTLSRLYFVLVPPGTDRMDLDLPRFIARLQKWTGTFAEFFEGGPNSRTASADPFQKSRQPLVAADAAGVLMNMGSKRKKQFRPEAMPLMFAFIAATTDELDCSVIEAR
jgi:hypothetical protein